MKIVTSILTLMISLSTIAQVEEFKMRQDVESFQLKDQSIGEITQKIDVIYPHKETNTTFLKTSDIYSKFGNIYQYPNEHTSVDIQSRSYTGSQNTVSLDGIQFQSNDNLYSISPFLNMQNIRKIELLYGQNTLMYGVQSLGSQSSFYTNNFELQDSMKANQLKLNVLTNNQSFGYTPSLQWNNIAKVNSFSIDVGYQNQFNNDYIQVNNSTKERVFFAFKDQIKFNQNSKLNLYFQATVFGSYSIYNNTANNYNQLISYIKWDHKTEESKLYTKMDLSLSFFKTSKNIVNNMFENDFYPRDQFKVSLQWNLYKNLNSKNVFFYGANTGFEEIEQSYSYRVPLNNLINKFVQSSAYFKHEYRMNDNVALFWGVRAGADYMQISNFGNLYPNLSGLFPNHFVPNGSVNLAWTKHTCENSNYSVSWTNTLRNPMISELLNPIYSNYFKIVGQLNSEKISNMEVNIYRKFEDKLELNAALYSGLTWDAIRTSNFSALNSSDRAYFQMRNIPLLLTSGVQLDFKYHVSKRIQVFGNFNAVTTRQWAFKDSFDQLAPIYGRLGVKYLRAKWSTQLYSNCNTNKTLQDKLTNNVSPMNTNPWMYNSYQNEFATFHWNLSFQPSRNFKFYFTLDNILDIKYQPYLGQLTGAGRMILAGIQWNN